MAARSLSLFRTITMLRRGATTIKLTPEDIQEYDKTVNSEIQRQNLTYLKVDQLQEQEPDVSINTYKDRNDRMGVNRTGN